MDAHQSRLELAGKQRMQKTKDKWVSFADKVVNNFSKHTTRRGISLGDEIEFTKATAKGRGYVNFSFCKGVVFALGENTILAVYRGRLEKVNYPNETAIQK